ncbi:hypothetical protein ALC56_04171 [Trachymyrmex septentrionalis]|uniref:Uncharacterized protein n=1 Tax=Trachymyrmex septentrionalis TaxID=34720 RepID=A0A151JY81_9HYME|nr:hypothetical protein ALC56_04171 [Trachymyrmex septentrionalis]
MLTGVCSVEKCPPKFYDLKIYGKTHVPCVKKARMHRRHETTQNLPLNVACLFLDFVITDLRESSTTWPSWRRSYAFNTYLLLI